MDIIKVKGAYANVKVVPRCWLGPTYLEKYVIITVISGFKIFQKGQLRSF